MVIKKVDVNQRDSECGLSDQLSTENRQHSRGNRERFVGDSPWEGLMPGAPKQFKGHLL